MNPQTFSWLLIAASIAAEVAGTVAMRYSDGLTRPLPSLVTGISYLFAIWSMSLAVRHLEVGLAYAVWAGTGTALIALAGMLWLGESTAPTRIIALLLIVLGVLLLKAHSG
ncbi:Quaternary ammonium compound-resistance protein sugE [Delftia tsuruhatensis]|uniref:DMT family transporter n=1 Tax=Delftia tsuruhatensis TaxID=180282 RepID=UPI001E6B4289|nr:multidrug efflux SMR transporter [Delftia tsuruhatensis]CAB5722415.1 Quaternary ammonium compound-resistance protein sugE [Delftia tsuruhatensis]CAC9682417.1 Quaternary ammonium compound-resistance protein sugE [Delftia tsuruhatensis]